MGSGRTQAAASHFFKIPTKVLSLLLSSGVFSPMVAPGPGVDALDDCSEGGAERPDDDEAMVVRCRDTQGKERVTSGLRIMRLSVKDVNVPQSQLTWRGLPEPRARPR